MRDLVSGAFTRVSIGSGGAEPNSHSTTPAVSHDGCEVAFTSQATNLVQGDNGQAGKVFVRDRCAGSTEIVSLTSAASNNRHGHDTRHLE